MPDNPGNQYYNDHWCLDIQHLGYESLGEKTLQLICECEPPFAVAVCGGWGSGKTSLLRYLMARTGGCLLRLDPENVFLKTEKETIESPAVQDCWNALFGQDKGRIASVWFNPWQHQFESNPLHALLHEMYNQFGRLAKFGMEGKKLGQVTLNTGLRLLKDLLSIGPVKVKIDAEAAQKAGENYEKQHYLAALDSQRFPLYFEQAVAHLATGITKPRQRDPDEDARLILFIDDLDRCQPQQAYKLLEAIKLYLNTRHCVFVFGVDYHRLVHEFANSVTDFRGDEKQAADYLDKMFQALIPIPIPADNDFRTFLEKLSAGGQLEPHLDTLGQILERNPRKTKNFLNSLRVHLALKENVGASSDEVQKLILVHYLKSFYPRVHRALQVDPGEGMPDLHDAIHLESPVSRRSRFFARELWNPMMEPLIDASELDKTSYHGLTEEMYACMRHQVVTYKARERFRQLFKKMFKREDDITPYL